MREVVSLRDGRKVAIRDFTLEDKEGLVSFYASLSPEALKWGLPPYDRQRIERWVSNLSNAIILVAEHEGRIVGNLNVFVPQLDRIKDNGELLIYIHQGFQKAGLGTALMKTAIEEARGRGLHRLHLTVVADNEVAIRVYEKAGFGREGVGRETYLGDDGRYHDDVQMGLILKSREHPNGTRSAQLKE